MTKKLPPIIPLFEKLRRLIQEANATQAKFNAAWKRLQELADPFRKEKTK